MIELIYLLAFIGNHMYVSMRNEVAGFETKAQRSWGTLEEAMHDWQKTGYLH
jgi:hypothetical protein